MKTNLKINTALIILSLAIAMGGCKSPAAPDEKPVTENIDTTAAPPYVAAPDTTAAATPPAIDTTPRQAPLTLIINDLRSTTAPVVVGAYGTDNDFPDPKDQLKEYKFTPHGKQLIAKIANLKFGVYALAIYQDVNSNGKIDKNMIGIPTEPYAFSNNYKPVVKAPNFDNCKFQYDSKTNTVTVKMLN